MLLCIIIMELYVYNFERERVREKKLVYFHPLLFATTAAQQRFLLVLVVAIADCFNLKRTC